MKHLFTLLLILLCGCTKQPAPPAVPEHPQRVISLAPSLTETIFAIGAEAKLVGNTEWCNYPEAAKKIPRIGGYMTLNAEQTLALHPDALIMLSEHEHLRAKADELGLPVVMLSNKSLTDILDSIQTLGVLLGHEHEATTLLTQMHEQINQTRAAQSDTPKPRVLVTIGRNMGSQGIDSAYCVGRTPFHNELIEIAGGVNACQIQQPYPKISAEGLIAMNPDIIIDLLDSRATPADIKQVKQNWLATPQIRAAQNGQIHLIADDYTLVPGPRFTQLLKEFADLIQSAEAE